MKDLQPHPSFWSSFNYERSKKSKLRELLISKFVSLSVPPKCTPRDIVNQIANASQIPVESLPDVFNSPVLMRGHAVFGFAGDEFDRIAGCYDNMQWWVSDKGLNMSTFTPSQPRRPPTFDELMREFEVPMKVRTPSSAKQNARSKTIDDVIRQIGESLPRTQGEIFKALDQRHVPLPLAEPFSSAKGWIDGLRRNEKAARAWLSKRWKKLRLAPLPRGPKNDESAQK